MGDSEADRAREDQLLEDWSEELAKALEVSDLDVDIRSVLGLAGRAAHGIARPAAPLTTFLAGYAAGVAAGSGAQSPQDATEGTLRTARALCQAKLSD